MGVDDARFDQTPRPGAPTEVEQLRTLLYTDDLTGLYNRRFFRHCIEEQKTQSESTNSPFALLILDIDHFKQINDTYGHAVGDAALIHVAKELKDFFKDRGWVFRYAGDEFVVVLRDCGENQAAALCDALLSRVSGFLGEDKENFPLKNISLSMGFSIFPDDSTVISEVLHLSDRALYASKEAGRSCFRSGRQIIREEKENVGHWPIVVHCESLIGRQTEWNILQSHFSDCRNGKGRLLFVTGEAGIGKSRLLRQFCRRQRTGDFHILVGQCTEGTLIHSYAPVRSALKKGFEAKDPATVNIYKNLEEHYRRELIALVPEFDRFEKEPLHAKHASDKYFLLESIYLLLQGLSRQLPTVLLLEDIHWGDEATLNLLQYLARNVQNEKILLLATFRDEEALQPVLPSILKNMSRESLYDTIDLQALKREESGQMLEEIFHGFTVPDSFKLWIHEESEGIPFYIEELVKILLEEGYIQRSGNEVQLRKPDKSVLPYSIRALVQRRVGRLNDALQRVLGFSSIIGYEFDLHILVKLIEENEGYLLDQLDQLTKLQLIREIHSGMEDRFAFSHNKIRDVIYEEMGLIKRKKFHRKVGEILEHIHKDNLGLFAEDLAYHFEQAGIMQKAFAYSLEAGKKALQVHAYSDAYQHFERCSKYKEMLDTTGTQLLAELHTYKGLSLEALGSWDSAILCYEQLLGLKKPREFKVLEADALNHLSRVHYKREDFERSRSLADQALSISRQENYRAGICQSFYNLGKNFWRMCDYPKALEYMNQAIELTTAEQDSGLRAKYLNSAGIIHLERSEFESALQHFRRALEIFQQRGDRPGMIECLLNISIIRHTVGNMHEARQNIVNAFALAQEIGDPFGIAACAVNQAELELDLSNYDLADKLNERAGKIYIDLGHSLGLTYYYQNQALYRMIAGELDPALAAATRARKLAEEKHLRKRVSELMRQEASIYYFQGDFSGTFGALTEALKLCTEINDEAGATEAELKLGYVCLALLDVEGAKEHWRIGTAYKTKTPASEFLFWKAAAEGFTAVLDAQESKALQKQEEMRSIAKKMEHAYLITVSHMLSSMQLHHLGRISEALIESQEAEKTATQFRQGLWLTRSRIYILEQRRLQSLPVAGNEVMLVMEAAKRQKQNEVIHRCYKMLFEVGWSDDKFRREWLQHWNSWQLHVPEPFRPRFEPF
jgi:diguanylate cyclase (GGDEF)-like protein